jgi:Domain of unknown function (DUF4296)
MKKTAFGILLLLTACVGEVEPPPGGLNQQQMVAILTEIHLAEAEAQQAGFKTADSTQLYYKYLEKKILKRFKTDSTQYHDSYRFYVQHAEEMKKIYDAVVDSLNVRQARKKL